MAYEWKPKRTLAECNKIMDSPGSPLETEWKTIGDRTVKVFKNQIETIRDIWLSTIGDNSDFVVYGLEERYTFAEAHPKVLATIGILQSHGVKKGDRVVICMRNLPAFTWVFWAAQSLGAIAVMVNGWSPFPALRHCMLNTSPVVVVLDPERALTLEPVLQEMKDAGAKGVYVTKAGPGQKKLAGFLDYEEGLKKFAGVKEYPKVDLKADDNSLIMFTSGTTSFPKGVLCTHRQIGTVNMIAMAGAVRGALRRGEDFPAPDPNAPQWSMLVATPLFHITGLYAIVASAYTRGKMITMPKWNLKDAVTIIKKEKVTGFGGVPFIVQEILDAFDGDDHVIAGIGFGGTSPPENLPRLIREKFSGVKVGQTYGMTEANGAAFSNGDEDYHSRPTSCGVLTIVNDVKIRDVDTGEEVPVGTAGEIYLWGVNIAQGYWGDEKATKEAFLPGGWYRTGDVGYLDEEGFLYISDRAKEIIIRGGENISAGHVESKLFDHPSVHEAAVLPLKDEKWGEVVGAIVTIKPDYANKVTEEELIKFVESRLPKHEVPVMVWIRDEMMPRNPSSKILKRDLKPLIEAHWAEVKRSRSKL